MTDPLFALSLAVIVAALYILVLRLIDVNEKEPVWALALVLLIGVVCAAVAAAVVEPSFRELEAYGTAITAEVSKFIAIALGVIALEGVSRSRGWSEINGPVDGLIYGAAAGLGFATGDALIRELSVPATVVGLGTETGSFALLWTTLLAGLSEGLFGALIGAGFGWALSARAAGMRLVGPVLGLLAALVVHYLYLLLAEGNALSGTEGAVRQWVALLIPVVFIVALLIQGLRQESGAIAEELADEAAAGVVTEEELKRLRSPGARRAQYMSKAMKGDIEGWLALRGLHNRQVQLALTERRLRNEDDPERRRDIEAEVHRIRASIIATKQSQGDIPIEAPASEGGAA